MRINWRNRYCSRSSACIATLAVCASIAIIGVTPIFFHNSITSSYQWIETFTVDETDLNDAKIKFTSNLHLLREDYFNKTHLRCRYPTLTIDNPEIWEHLNPVRELKPDCGESSDWIYVDNGTLRLSEQALLEHKPIMCGYRPIFRLDEYSSKEGNRVYPVIDRMPLTSDFFHVDCQGKDGSSYSNFHMGLRFDKTLHARSMQKPMSKTHLGYNILMFGFDSVSRMTFMRFLPKTYSFLIKELGAIVMKGYNIVGDGTSAALFPILTGQAETELPESRRGYPGAKTVDEFPWIWKQFKDNGYVTQWAEDMQFVGTFQYRLKGFRDPPVDHYGRPFYRFVEPKETSKPLCFGSTTRLQAMFNWIRDLFEMYPHQPKFSYLFHSTYSHNSNNLLPYADSELLAFLKMIQANGYLNNTMLIIMTDHGARFASLRKTSQGELEERLPFMSIRMPPAFQAQHPMIMRNLRLNSHRLTTPFDIHETFEHLFEFHSVAPYQSKSKRAFSLFQLVPEGRTCPEANVQQHWCACHKWHDISVKELIIQQYSQAVVNFLNKFVSDHKQDCATLTLVRVNKASELDIDNDLLQSVPASNENITMSQLTNKTRFYQIQLETTPGNGEFEVTAEYDSERKTFDIQKRYLSRMNRYNDDPACIAEKRPDMREICYCSNLLISTNTSNSSTAAIMNN